MIAAKNPDPEEVKYEISDFLYHMMVLMAAEPEQSSTDDTETVTGTTEETTEETTDTQTDADTVTGEE